MRDYTIFASLRPKIQKRSANRAFCIFDVRKLALLCSLALRCLALRCLLRRLLCSLALLCHGVVRIGKIIYISTSLHVLLRVKLFLCVRKKIIVDNIFIFHK